MTSFTHQKVLTSKDRRAHLVVISIILLGPLATLPALVWNDLNFLNLIFPVTADSLALEFDPEGYRELFVIEILWLLVLIKILLMGAILLKRLLKEYLIGQLLLRFYVLIFLICLVKLTMFSMYFSDNAERLVLAIGPLVFFGWCLVIGVLIQRHRTYLRQIRATKQ